ncbi:MAG: polysaccharide pyruvyl transferase family protein [Clostridiaceae bacterium]
MQSIKNVIKYVLDIARRAKGKFKVRIRTIRTFKGRKQQVAILIGSPEHGNIGDHAISLAEIEFLKEYYPGLHIVEITGQHFRKDTVGIMKRVKSNDIIFVTGGGFLGNLWMVEEGMVRKVIQVFPNNPIIIFPQTIYFNSDETGKMEQKKSKEIYENHKNLCICLRDKKSYDFIKTEFNKVSKSLFTPDIVTYLNMSKPILKRNRVLLCFRTDKERVLSDEQLKEIEQLLYSRNLSYTYTSTVVDYGIKITDRKSEIEKKINEFKESRIVITDRLHGMLFAAITGTPCIALDNLSGKVRGVYQWIKYLNYIKFVEDWGQIDKNIGEILKFNECSYENVELKYKFEKLSKQINTVLEKVY